MIVRTSLAVMMLAAALASPALAQTAMPGAAPDPAASASRDALLQARGEAYHRASDAQQTEEELRATRALNDEIAAQNALADKADDAARLDYDAALATRAAQEQYDRDYAAWVEQVRLCRSGVRSACGTPAPER